MKETRKEAIAAGEKWYFTGKPCKRGHFSKRFTIEGSCYQCIVEYHKKTRAEVRKILADKLNTK